VTVYRNAQAAFLGELSEISARGETVTVRGTTTREIQAAVLELTAPCERVILVPGRNNSIFAAIAETMWVLAGRNDLDYLSAYLPRAPDFSDDGVTWRGAYGPRLRDWNGTDQIAEIRNLLDADPTSRRAVATLYDPDRDFVQSKDIPCNNWLHFLERDGKLHLNVTARSTDIWWGLSGINLFEWSVLLEVMAYWLGVDVGVLRFFTSSLHLYERHYRQAAEVLRAEKSAIGTTYGPDSTTPRFATTWQDFDDVMREWMGLEARLRAGDDLDELGTQVADPLLRDFLTMLDIYWNHQRSVDANAIRAKIGRLGSADLAAAATEYIARNGSAVD
jgi:thymidylate synthase